MTVRVVPYVSVQSPNPDCLMIIAENFIMMFHDEITLATWFLTAVKVEVE